MAEKENTSEIGRIEERLDSLLELVRTARKSGKEVSQRLDSRIMGCLQLLYGAGRKKLADEYFRQYGEINSEGDTPQEYPPSKQAENPEEILDTKSFRCGLDYLQEETDSQLVRFLLY